MSRFHPLAVGVVVFLLFIGTATTAHAALTGSQIQAIISLLSSFGADQTTIINVNASLRGEISPSTPPTVLPSGGAMAGGIVSSCPTLTRTLSIGSRGSDVVQLQNFLISQSLLSARSNTGYFGKLTQSAVQSWQSSRGIVSYGTPWTNGYGAMGPRTRAALSNACANQTSSTSASNNTSSGTSTPSTSSVIPTPSTHAPQSKDSQASSTPKQNPIANGCVWNGTTVSNGQSVTAFQTGSVSYGQSCQSETRICSNGNFSGGYANSSCTVGAATACTFNGQSITSGNAMTAYQASSVAYGSQCVSEMRSCSNGFLSGSYQYSACSVATPPIAPVELLRMPLLDDSDFSESVGVQLMAQIPEQGMILYDKTPAASVWQTPMASRRLNDGSIEIWYLRFDYAEPSFMDQATLDLGKISNGQWTLSQVSATPPAWGGINNVVLTRSPYPSTWGGFNPHQIVTDPSGGLLMLYWDQPNSTGNAGIMRATASSPGTTWTKVPGTVATEYNDVFTLSRVGNQYRLYQTALQPWSDKPYPDNLPTYKRVITLRTSTDSATWTAQNVASPMLAPDTRDAPETEFYAFKSFAYGNGYAGILWKYFADPNRPGQHSKINRSELVVSADGVNWKRPYRNIDLGFFSYADPFIMNGSLFFATQGAPDSSSEGDTFLKGWLTDRLVAAVGDGGTFRTKPFYFPPNGININANTQNGGWIDVTVCDGAGTPIVGWAPHHIQNDNGINLPLPWNAGHEPVSLRITLGGGAKVFGISARPSP